MPEMRLVARASNISDLDRFKELASQAISLVREKDPGTLQYEWYLDEDAKSCTVLETYASSEAAAAHVENVGPVLGGLMDLCQLSRPSCRHREDRLRRRP